MKTAKKFKKKEKTSKKLKKKAGFGARGTRGQQDAATAERMLWAAARWNAVSGV